MTDFDSNCTLYINTPFSKDFTIAGILLIIPYTWSTIYILKKKQQLTQQTYRYKFFSSFYTILLSSLIARLLYFITTFTFYKGYFVYGENDRKPRADDNADVPAWYMVWYALYSFFLSLSNIFNLLATQMIAFTWYRFTTRIKYEQQQRQYKLNKLKKISSIIFILLSLLYVIASFGLILSAQLNKYISLSVNYTVNRMAICAINIIMLLYDVIFGRKMIKILKRLSILQGQEIDEENHYKSRLYVIIILSGIRTIVIIFKVLFYIKTEKVLETQLCQYGNAILIFYQLVYYGILEIIPLMIYQSFLVPQQFVKSEKGSRQSFRSIFCSKDK